MNRGTKRTASVATLESDGTDFFVLYNGKRVARRGYPDTPQAMTWVSLEPGVKVHSPPDLSEIAIEIDGVRVH